MKKTYEFKNLKGDSMKKMCLVSAIALTIGLVGMVEAKSNRQYTYVTSQKYFNSYIKSKPHVVVWFYHYAKKGDKRELTENMSKDDFDATRALYNKVADVEKYNDKDNIIFLSVNVARNGGQKIFAEHRVLDDGTIIELPAIVLFRNGRMVENEVGGKMTEERVEKFIERSFGLKPSEPEILK